MDDLPELEIVPCPIVGCGVPIKNKTEWWMDRKNGIKGITGSCLNDHYFGMAMNEFEEKIRNFIAS